MKRYFFYDPHHGMAYFDTQDACLHAAQAAMRRAYLAQVGAPTKEELPA